MYNFLLGCYGKSLLYNFRNTVDAEEYRDFVMVTPANRTHCCYRPLIRSDGLINCAIANDLDRLFFQDHFSYFCLFQIKGVSFLQS